MNESRLKVAHHEAGHFVADYYLVPDRYVYALEIIREKHCRLWGCVRSEWPPEVQSGFKVPTDEVLKNAVIGCYAGAAVELRLGLDPEYRVRLHARDDDEEAHGILGVLGKPELEAELRARAADFVAEHWREIHALATELAKRGTLSGREAEALVLEVAGRAVS